jgi:predicted transcriptional regulator
LTKPADLNLKLVRDLASIGCSTVEIAAVLGVSARTVQRRCRTEIDAGHEMLKVSLRRWQYSKAKEGNTTMLIWLGKQLLGQKDVSRIELSDVPDELFKAEVQRRLTLVPGK